MTYIIPTTVGVSALQRRSKAVLNQAKKSRQPVFLTERNQVSAVLLSRETYEQLIQALESAEESFWLGATESSLGFWGHKSNSAYEKML